jgi:hypothetical protein
MLFATECERIGRGREEVPKEVATAVRSRVGGSMKVFSPTPLKATDSLKIFEFADLFGFPASAVLTAIERQRRTINKPYYSIPDLKWRWNCSRATVYAVLRESEYKILDLARPGKKKGPKGIPAHVVEQIEKDRMRPLEDAA